MWLFKLDKEVGRFVGRGRKEFWIGKFKLVVWFGKRYFIFLGFRVFMYEVKGEDFGFLSFFLS